MSEYRFHLQKYKYGSKISCPNCGKPRCFVKYVDAEGEIVFPYNVGKNAITRIVAVITILRKNTLRPSRCVYSDSKRG